jgi:ribulose bisphosphate carboxylase small subunit
MKVFEVRTPDGRVVRHEAESAEQLKGELQPGYAIAAEVYGADDQRQGGWSVPVGGKSLMALLLEHHGDELRAWLRENDVAMPQIDNKARRAAVRRAS